MAEHILEGTWEEIQLHAGELAGRRLKVTVLPDAPGPQKPNGSATSSALPNEERLLDALAALGSHLPPVPDETYSRTTIYGDHD